MPASPSSMRVCLVALLLSTVAGHQTFLMLIPNADDYPQVLALGHQNKVGGGPLNAFGEDFRKHKFQWSLQMCLSDADGDGETNGMELGDPCCTWSVGDRPSRSWGLSHPGDPEDTCRMLGQPVDSAALLEGVAAIRGYKDLAALLTKHGLECSAPDTSTNSAGVEMSPETQAQRDAEFWKFYFKDSAEPPPPVTLMVALSDVGWTILYPVLHPVDFFGGFISFAWSAIAKAVRALSQGGLYKAGVDLFGMVVPMLVIYKLYGGQAKELWNTPRKEKLQMVVMAVLWVECISGLLHITLDNPAFQSIPYLGAAARDFQWHHKRPTHICHQTWHEFLGAIDGGIIFLFVAASFIRPKAWSRSLSIFALIAFPLFYLMMASHRWSHIRRDQLPPAVALLQSYGILLSQDAHSVHHANYDQNFSLMTGWSNPFINWACIHVMKPRNTHWVGVFAAWTLLPFWAPFVIEFAKKRGFALPCSSADRSASKTTQA